MNTRKASRKWTRGTAAVASRMGDVDSGTFGDKKYQCRKHGAGVVHDKLCRVSRPLCKYRRAVCRCNAVPWPHRPGSMRGCREGGIPEVLMKSRSFREAHGYGSKKRHFSRTRAAGFKRG